MQQQRAKELRLPLLFVIKRVTRDNYLPPSGHRSGSIRMLKERVNVRVGSKADLARLLAQRPLYIRKRPMTAEAANSAMGHKLT